MRAQREERAQEEGSEAPRERRGRQAGRGWPGSCSLSLSPAFMQRPHLDTESEWPRPAAQPGDGGQEGWVGSGRPAVWTRGQRTSRRVQGHWGLTQGQDSWMDSGKGRQPPGSGKPRPTSLRHDHHSESPGPKSCWPGWQPREACLLALAGLGLSCSRFRSGVPAAGEGLRWALLGVLCKKSLPQYMVTTSMPESRSC